MDDFNPDVYLQQKTASGFTPSAGFDPDAYLAEKSPKLNPNDPEHFVSGVGFPNVKNYPNSLYTDPTVNDALMAQGVAGLGKTALGLGARGVGAALEAVPATKNIVPTVGDIADDMLLKSMGTRAAQARQVGGIEEARQAAKLAREAGAENIFSTERGSRQAIKNLIDKEGRNIGGLRKEAGTAPTDYYQTLEQELMKKYNPVKPDVYSSKAPQIETGINTIQNVANEAVPTHAGIAKGVTNLNRFATGEKLVQPNTPLTEVAQKAAAANDAGIVQALGPEKGKAYLEALQKESGAFHLQPFIERGAEREALSRGGGKGILQSLIQKGADAGGYRAASKGFNTLHEALSTNPGLPALNASQAQMAAELEKYLKEQYGGQ